MAQVLEAIALGAEGFERRVAIKRILPQDSDDPHARGMFLQEARLGSRLHHGGIVQILDFGTLDGHPFLAMEFVDGMDARLATRREPMPAGVACHVIAEVAHALAYLHELVDEAGQPLHAVHRDVSPQNILLAWDGGVKLSDFGIATWSERDHRTATGLIKGKVRYMPPEQALGQKVTHKSDVFALGATLEALLGSEPDASQPFLTKPEARMANANSRGIDPRITELIGSCTQHDPALRPTARELAQAAGTLAAGLLGRDGRSALTTWLDQQRSVQRKASALDDLMGFCIVGVEASAEERAYTVGKMEAPVPAPVAQTEPARERENRRGRLWAAVVGVTLMGAGAAAVTAWTAAPRQRRPQELEARSDRTLTITPVVNEPTGVASGRPQPVAAPAEIAPEPAVPPKKTSDKPSSRRPRATDRPRASQAVSAAGQGWIAVGGAGLIGAEVLLDGKVAGYAPLQKALPAGKHHIVARDPKSKRIILERTIDVRSDHTPAEPSRVIRD